MSGDRVVHCIWCRSTRVQPAREFRSERWPMLHCVDCGLRFLSPIPNEDELRRAYAYGRYASETYSLDDRAAAQRMGASSQILDTLTLHAGHPGRLLDVGCSVGDLLLSASRRGWTGTGIEIDPETAAVARTRTGADVRAGTVETVLRPEESFDGIVMNHSLEHFPAPGRDLDTVLQHLAPGGLLLIRVPNMDSLAARALGRAWRWYLPPVHISYFTQGSLSFVLERRGLVAVSQGVQGSGDVMTGFELATSPFDYLYRTLRTSEGNAKETQRDLRSPPGSGPRSLLHALVRARLQIERVVSDISDPPHSRGGLLPHNAEVSVLYRRPSPA